MLPIAIRSPPGAYPLPDQDWFLAGERSTMYLIDFICDSGFLSGIFAFLVTSYEYGISAILRDGRARRQI
ncbi:hypothetical protein XI00_09150 [Bradyrhizobium sp. CCBAU 21359]|nr:hypothetical protein [Bradyrhizobium sp. CCBAU 21359]